MDSVINVQEPFMYHIWPIIVVLILLTVLGIIILAGYYRKKTKPVQTVEKPVERKFYTMQERSALKNKYLGLLTSLEARFRNGEIERRPAYQELSALVRSFLKERSGVDVTNCTLEQIKEMHVPVITPLIANYYEPEFALETDDDLLDSIINAKRIIERWN